MKYTLFVLSLLILPTIVFAQEYGFVPLTQVPFLTDTGNSFDLSQFLNNLYRLAIGVAAVIAVLQIMRAGIMYMGGDSVTEKKEAKNLIGLSIAGLVLVLSPVVVFSIINPEILSLKIDRIEELDVDLRDTETGTGAVCNPACEEGLICASGGRCVSPAGQGDGTCSQTCNAAAGQICRSGQCVAITEDTCPTTPIGNGVSVPSARAQRCCAAQTGCSVQTAVGSASSIPFCSCTPDDDQDTDTPQNPSSDLVYGYRIFVERTSGGAPFMYTSRSRFSTSQACSTDMETVLRERGYTVSGQSTGARQCNCFTPLSQQPGC